MMECDDFDGAIALLMASADPVRSLDSLVFVRGQWNARVSTVRPGRFRRGCTHPDMTTSMLMALLLSDPLPSGK